MKKYWLWFGSAFPFIVFVLAFLTLSMGFHHFGITLLFLPFILVGDPDNALLSIGFCKDTTCVEGNWLGYVFMIGWVLFYFLIGALIGWIYGKIRKHKRLA